MSWNIVPWVEYYFTFCYTKTIQMQLILKTLTTHFTPYVTIDTENKWLWAVLSLNKMWVKLNSTVNVYKWIVKNRYPLLKSIGLCLIFIKISLRKYIHKFLRSTFFVFRNWHINCKKAWNFPQLCTIATYM